MLLNKRLYTFNLCFSRLSCMQILTHYNVFVTPKLILEAISQCFTDIHGVSKSLSHFYVHGPVEVKQGKCCAFLS